jgi:hypothetical protein
MAMAGLGNRAMTLRRAIPLALLLIGMQFWPALIAGTIVLTTNEITRAAGLSTMVLNALAAKTHIANAKAVAHKVFGKKTKSTKGKKT